MLQEKFNTTKNLISSWSKWFFTIIIPLIVIFKIPILVKPIFHRPGLLYLLFYFEISLLFLSYYLIFTSLFYLLWFTINNNVLDLDEFFFFFDTTLVNYFYLQNNFTCFYYILPSNTNILLNLNYPLYFFYNDN